MLTLATSGGIQRQPAAPHGMLAHRPDCAAAMGGPPALSTLQRSRPPP